MSDEHVETVRSAFEAGVRDRMNDVVALLDAEVELRGAVGGLEEGDVVRGRDAVALELVPDRTVWAERRYEVQEIVEAGDRVVALVHEHRRGRASGVEIGADMAFIYSFNGRKISRIEPYMNQSEALAAVDAQK